MKESVVESFDLFAGLGAGQNIFAGPGAGQNILVLRQRYLLSSLEDIFSGISKIFQRKLNLALGFGLTKINTWHLIDNHT